MPPDDASEYGRLLAWRDRLVAAGADPADLEMPDRPLGLDPDPITVEVPDLGDSPTYFNEDNLRDVVLLAGASIVIAILALLMVTQAPSADAATQYSGTATWYCSSVSTCTAGHGPGEMIAAIDRGDSSFRKGDRVLVRSRLAGGGSVVVTIVDTCACGGVRLIDLSRAAFARLANPDLGVIPVTLEQAGGGPVPTGPPTDVENNPTQGY